MELTRRAFLVASGTAVLGLSLDRLALGAPAAGSAVGAAIPDYRSWEDVFRGRWRWDRVVKGTHTRVDCIAACSWNVFVKDGLVWREEQNATYAATRPGLPDFNPRGCQKGACYSALMYEPSRIKYPLRRVGPRGSGRWERVSWDEALTDIADRIIDVATGDGPECVVYDHGTTNIDFGPPTAGEMHLAQVVGATVLDSWAGVGDMPMGAVQTWGLYNADGTSDDWFQSDYIVVWLGNPVYTRIPEAHYMLEARYRGAKLVVIAPDYNATAIHADLWLNPRPSTDAALALGLAHVIVAEERYRPDYVKEQTDLPFLVREDTGRFLRQADLPRGGRDDVFYVWDAKEDRLTEAPGTQGHGRQTLALGGVDPALAGTFRVTLADGRTVAVRPLFERLREHLAAYAPERVAGITGVRAETVRAVAREFAAAGAAMIFASWGACKHHHSDLVQRAMILLVALTGNQGRPGGGLRIGAWWALAGFERLASGFEPTVTQRVLAKMLSPRVRDYEKFLTELTRERPITPVIPWLHVHAGLDRVVTGAATVEAPGGGTVEGTVAHALDRGWIPVHPKPPKRPRIFLYSGSNPLRRWPAPQVVEEVLWPKLDLIVNVNFRTNTTGLKSDYILPAAGYYEKLGIKFTQSYVPYVVFGDEAVPPLWESKSEWEIAGLLARRLQERARERGVQPYRDAFGKTHDLARAYEEWSLHGRLEATRPDAAMAYIIENSDVLAGRTWEDARAHGALPIASTGPYAPINAICSDHRAGETVWPAEWFVKDKQPWPTLTGRQQFLLDHEWFQEIGESLPVYKPPPDPGARFPLRLTGGHTRWSVHAIWRDTALMLRLQRGEPVVYLSVPDAAARGIGDHDRVRVFNALGSFRVRAKLAPSVQPGQAVIYHAWEPFQFEGWLGSQVAVASPWKLLHLVGDYGQLHYRMYYGAPGHAPRDTRVEIERA
jgi:DMSO reductase family type II enzyme molybdopterin subunit